MTGPDAAPRILVVGSTMIDLITYADRLPMDGETVVGTRFQSGFGGKGANQAVIAARFGAAIAMVNAVGDDDHGTATTANLAAEGIDTRFVTRVPGSSGVAPIWVDANGTNRIIIVPGANDHVPAASAVAAVEQVRPSVVIGQFEIPQEVTAAAFRAARSIGAVTILNPAPAADIDPDLLAATDWLVPNETEFAHIGGSRGQGSTAAADLDAAGAEVDAAGAEVTDHNLRTFASRAGVSLIVTLGPRGAVVLAKDGDVAHVPAPQVEAVDTTGAGDAFVGAFAVGLALGWAAVTAARLGCAAAADSVTRPGTQRSYPDRARAQELVRRSLDHGFGR
jgi:ribokinase